MARNALLLLGGLALLLITPLPGRELPAAQSNVRVLPGFAVPAVCAPFVWEVEPVTGAGGVGGKTTLILDPAGWPHIGYEGSNYGVKYAYCDGSDWQVQVVGGAFTGDSSLALDAAGRPHISFYGGSGNLKYAFYDGSAWQVEEVDRGADLGYYGSSSAAYADEHWNWTNYDWLLAEGENILALVLWAIAAGRGTAALAVTRPVMRYLDIRGRWGELFKYGELLYRMAQTLNDQRTAAWICRHWFAWLYGEQAEVEQARSWATEGIALYESLPDLRGLCLAKLYLSRALRRGRQLAASVREANASMELARSIDYGDGVAMAYDQLGKITRDQGLWEQARAYFNATLSWCEEHEEESNLDITVRMNVLGNLGWLEFQLGNLERGKELCERSLRALVDWWSGVYHYVAMLPGQDRAGLGQRGPSSAICSGRAILGGTAAAGARAGDGPRDPGSGPGMKCGHSARSGSKELPGNEVLHVHKHFQARLPDPRS